MAPLIEIAVTSVAGNQLANLRGPAEWTKADICLRVPDVLHSSWAEVRLFPGDRELVDGTSLGALDAGPRVEVMLVRDPAPAGVICVPTADGDAAILRARDQSRALTVSFGDENPLEMTASPNGLMMATRTTAGNCRIWSANSGRRIHRLETAGGTVKGASWSWDSQLIVTSSVDGIARVWDVATGRCVRHVSPSSVLPEAELRRRGVPRFDLGILQSAHFAPRDMRLLTAYGDACCVVWADAGMEMLAMLMGQGYCCRFSPSGASISALGLRNIGKIWSGEDVPPAYEFPIKVAFAGPEAEVVFQPQEEIMPLSGNSASVRVLRVTGGGHHGILVGHALSVLGTAFSHSGIYITTYSADNTFALWGAETCRCVWNSGTQRHGVHLVRFSFDDERLMTVNQRGRLTVWQREGGALPDDKRQAMRVRRGMRGVPVPLWTVRAGTWPASESAQFWPIPRG